MIRKKLSVLFSHGDTEARRERKINISFEFFVRAVPLCEKFGGL